MVKDLRAPPTTTLAVVSLRAADERKRTKVDMTISPETVDEYGIFREFTCIVNVHAQTVYLVVFGKRQQVVVVLAVRQTDDKQKKIGISFMYVVGKPGFVDYRRAD